MFLFEFLILFFRVPLVASWIKTDQEHFSLNIKEILQTPIEECKRLPWKRRYFEQISNKIRTRLRKEDLFTHRNLVHSRSQDPQSSLIFWAILFTPLGIYFLKYSLRHAGTKSENDGKWCAPNTHETTELNNEDVFEIFLNSHSTHLANKIFSLFLNVWINQKLTMSVKRCLKILPNAWDFTDPAGMMI